MEDRSQPSKPTINDIRVAYRFAIISLSVTLLGTVFGLAFYIKDDGSSLCLVYGVQSFINFMSSAVILWRFFVPNAAVDEADVQRTLAGRELRAAVGINLLIIASGIALVPVSVADMSRGMEAQGNMRAVTGMSFVAAIVFGMMSFVKFRLAVALDSGALHQDGVCSLTGTVLAIALFFDSLIIQHKPEAWWLDPTVAFMAGVTCLLYGAHAAFHARYRDNIPFCNLEWWAMSRGIDEDIIESVRKSHQLAEADVESIDAIDLTEYEEDIDEIYLQ